MGCGCNNGCGGSGFGGNSCWIIILLLLCCGCGDGGFGGGMDCCWIIIPVSYTHRELFGDAVSL